MKRNIVLVLVFIGIQSVYLATTSQDTDLKIFNRQIRKELFGNANSSECVNITYKHQRKLEKEVATIKNPHWTVAILSNELINGQILNEQHGMGVLINLQVVLTAAHCVFNKTLGHLKVRAGEGYKSSGTNLTYVQESHIEKVVIPDSYNATYPQQDIALVFLKNGFTNSAGVKIACLPPINAKSDTAHVKCSTNGWTSTKWRTPTTRGSSISQVKMRISPFGKCEKVLQKNIFGPEFKLSESFICAHGGMDRKQFEANGGAPLFCHVCGMDGIIVIGIMSWGFNTTTLPEAFTSIDKEKHWIARTLKVSQIEYPNCRIIIR